MDRKTLYQDFLENQGCFFPFPVGHAGQPNALTTHAGMLIPVNKHSHLMREIGTP
jgi:hypothetical protein